jgi:xanthine dehydrogenase YagR molybdenum-binding subunit
MPFLTTRRRILGGTLGTAAVATTGCARPGLTAEQAHPNPGAPAVVATPLHVETEVNGVARKLDVHPDRSALTVVRDALELTGSKRACGHGVCGACTMLVDGAPAVTCLLPATSLHERKVTTVEGLAAGDQLHPVQRAFMAEDALQCGYCTPGFVVAASAFYRKWRASTRARSRSEIRWRRRWRAPVPLRGVREHLGGGAAGVRGGVSSGGGDAAAARGAGEGDGAAQYTVDVHLPEQLEVAILRSPHAHAKVRKVDWSQALAHAGRGGGGRPDDRGRRRCGSSGRRSWRSRRSTSARPRAALIGWIVVEYELLPAAIGMAAARAPGRRWCIRR